MTPRKALRRFFFVRIAGGRVLHRVYKFKDNPVEGDQAECGLMMKRGWKWVTPLSQDRKLKKCKRCEHVAC